MATVLPFPNKEVSAAFSRSNSGFMLSLLKQLPSQSNIFYSPFSISTALAMVHMGARTDTLKEMSQALHFEEMDKDVHTAFASYLDFLSKETGNCTLKTANRIYQSMRFKPKESFLQNCNKHFKATVEAVDFSQSEEARKKINSWVSQHTENKIRDLIPARALNSATFMVLVNAIYFKGNWNSKFESKHTEIMEFQNTNEKFMTDMMHQKASFKFCHMPDLMLNALQLPYQGKTLSMLILLPTAVDGIESLEKNLTESVLKTFNFKVDSSNFNVGFSDFKD
ncbi:serpin B8-like [Saccostrea echinata]|uniref:serpin B8-like n=1 Tax=Saccostrea echinata TaxID=191078 RepID=UPI002A804B89|nr:serpin B8-like [Saccostrea echinata]